MKASVLYLKKTLVAINHRVLNIIHKKAFKGVKKVFIEAQMMRLDL